MAIKGFERGAGCLMSSEKVVVRSGEEGEGERRRARRNGAVERGGRMDTAPRNDYK